MEMFEGAILRASQKFRVPLLDRDDLAQIGRLAVWSALQRDSVLPSEGWAYTIARRAIIDELRRAYSRRDNQRRSYDQDVGLAPVALPTGDVGSNVEDRRALRDTVRSILRARGLARADIALALAYYVRGRTFSQIARAGFRLRNKGQPGKKRSAYALSWRNRRYVDHVLADCLRDSA